MGTASAPVVVASDHGGFELKEAVKRHLAGRGVPVLDVGTHDKGACDYPVFARAAAEAVATGKAWRGVVIDGAGIGSAMVANKVQGVRAGMAFDPKTAVNAAEHNGAHILTLGAGYLDEAAALAIVDAFLGTSCTVDRHLRRVAMIDALDGLRGPTPALPGAAGPTTSTHGEGMTPAAHDYDALVATITRVLSDNPGLLASIAPHAAGAHCPTCHPDWGASVSQQQDVIRRINAAGRGLRVSARLGAKDVPRDLAGLIDHTLLKPDATYADIDQLCDEARQYGFASVCVNPYYVARCAQRLRGAAPKVCTVIGFPLGATPKEIKAMEARKALRDGAQELDMVINIGALKSGDHKTVYEDIRILAEVAREGRALLKVIIETALLTDEEKVAACVLSRKAGAHFVKTSTGFAKGGATAADVALMAQAVEHKLEVKASGGVKSADDAKRMVEAGATRIGASVGVKIAQEERGERPAGGASASGGGY
ncbi:MAG: deoxyribose-phosphate aldolase [Deltaproteobacteria bacterium]|nr:MAG: deoxyribose-phosphate aldolase [Deltaproteobacteria bacterium]